jgi:hypothetical protein
MTLSVETGFTGIGNLISSRSKSIDLHINLSPFRLINYVWAYQPEKKSRPVFNSPQRLGAAFGRNQNFTAEQKSERMIIVKAKLLFSFPTPYIHFNTANSQEQPAGL